MKREMKWQRKEESDGIKLGSWNICRGWFGKESEIRQKMEELELEILFLQELDITNYSEGCLSIPGYDVFVQDGDKKRVATIIKKRTFSNVTQIQRNGVAQVWLKVEMKQGGHLTLGNIYREWNKNQEKDLEELCSWMEERPKQGTVIMAGDFNLDPSRFEDETYSLKRLGKNFLSRMKGLGLERVSFGNTFERIVSGQHIQSELDWVLIPNAELVKEKKVIASGLSDHNLIVWKLCCPQSCSKTLTKWARKLQKVNIPHLREDLLRQPWEDIAKVNCVDQMAGIFNDLFLQVLDQHAPLVQITYKRRISPKPSAALRRLRRLRDNARSKGKLHELQRLRTECRKLSRLETVQKVESRLTQNPSEAWKIVQEVTKKSQSQPVIKEGGVSLSEKECADTFNQYFIDKIKNIIAAIPSFSGDALQGTRKRAQKLNLKKGSFKLLPVQENAVTTCIKNLKPSHCPDIYGIAPAALKMAPEILAIPLTWIINKTIIEGKVPSMWKQGRVLPLHKKSARDQKENYRPVCILPSVSKVMEGIVQKQIRGYFEGKKIIPSSQFGFRQGRSTVQAAAAMEFDWKKARQNKMACGALFFDLSAAFDCINATLLTEKMKLYGASDNALRWVSSYLTGRQQRVDVGGSSSQMMDITVGSPQGSVVSPLLFLILVADIGEWVSEGSLMSYADDTSIYYANQCKEKVWKVLEKSAREVLSFMAATGLSANPTKTNFLFFSGRAEDDINIGGALIEEDSKETLLGITFNKRLTWKAHLEKLKPQLLQRIAILKRLHAKLPEKVLCQMIDPIFSSKVRYGLELFCDILLKEKSVVLRTLHNLHRKAMKAVLGFRSDSHPKDSCLYKRSGQVSIEQMALEATATLAWKCGKNWKEDPLISGRVEEHLQGQNTRQRSQRSFPPQKTRGTLVYRIVEIWEKLPDDIKNFKTLDKARPAIKSWAAHYLKNSFLHTS